MFRNKKMSTGSKNCSPEKFLNTDLTRPYRSDSHYAQGLPRLAAALWELESKKHTRATRALCQPKGRHVMRNPPLVMLIGSCNLQLPLG